MSDWPSMKEFTTTKVSELADVSETSVRRWCRQGVLPATKLGGHWRISREDLEAFLGTYQYSAALALLNADPQAEAPPETPPESDDGSTQASSNLCWPSGSPSLDPDRTGRPTPPPTCADLKKPQPKSSAFDQPGTRAACVIPGGDPTPPPPR